MFTFLTDTPMKKFYNVTQHKLTLKLNYVVFGFGSFYRCITYRSVLQSLCRPTDHSTFPLLVVTLSVSLPEPTP